MKKKNWAFIWVVFIVLALLCWCTPKIWGGAYTWYGVVHDDEADTVILYLQANNTTREVDTLVDPAGQGVYDSILYTLNTDSAFVWDVETIYGDLAFRNGRGFEISQRSVTASFGADDSVYVKGGVINLNTTEQGGIANADRWLVVTAIDTPATTVSGVRIILRDDGGSVVLNGVTLSDGTCSLNVVAGDYTVSGYSTGYAFNNRSITASTDPTNDTIYGDAFAPPVGIGGAFTVAYGHVTDFTGDSVENALVTITMPFEVWDSCAQKTVLPRTWTKSTDSTGFWSVDLTQSRCLQNKKYTIIAEYGNRKTKEYPFTLGTGSSQQIIIGE